MVVHTGTELLFERLDLAGLSLKNRIVMSPMSRYRSPGGIPNDGNVAYYERRAASGVGLVVTEATYIDHPAAQVYRNVPHFFGAEALEGWGRVREAVQGHGARIMPQLWHVGGVRRLGAPPDSSVPGIGPSAIVEQGLRVVEPMSEGDIVEVSASYARAARQAKDFGFDGVAIHGAHGYLLDQFLWKETNRRDDCYGGGIADRCRMGVEIVAAIRREVGSAFPIVFRFSQWKADDYEARIVETPNELESFLRAFVDAGVDVFDVSTRRFYQPAFEGDPRSLAAWTRKLSGKPVIAVGSVGLDQPHQSKVYRTADNVAARVTDLAEVCEALGRGDFDLVAVGRALLADALWPEKVRRGVFSEIAPFTREAMDNYV